jgi:NAD-dependent SIR2 family protein deacetylase
VSTGIEAPVAAEQHLAEAIELLRGARVAVLTGAGVSTDSGIPDYRGEGAPVRTPMTADLESRGIVGGVITQNVDGLHRRAGNRHVIELHGSMDRVLCLTCGQHYARQAIAARLEELNPEIDLETAIRPAPDGDVEVDDVDAMVIPACTVCGGILKPDVVFFGEFVPSDRFQAAASLVQGADVLLVAGSSLVVNSGMRLLEQARRKRLPIVIVNRGVTKGDGRAAVKVDAGASETLVAIADALDS